MTINIFLSYSTKDSNLFDIPLISEQIENKIKDSKTLYCQRDAGANWVEYMEKSIKNSDFFLLFCTPNAEKSDYVKSEYEAAFTIHKSNLERIIPIFIDEKYIPVLLRSSNGLNFDIYNREQSIDDLCSLILERTGKEDKKEKPHPSKADFKKVTQVIKILANIEDLAIIQIIDTGVVLATIEVKEIFIPNHDLLGPLNSAIVSMAQEIGHKFELYYLQTEIFNQLILKREKDWILSLYFYKNADMETILIKNMTTISLLSDSLFALLPEVYIPGVDITSKILEEW